MLQKGTLPGVASLDGKGASLTSAAAVSQIRLAADAVNAASTLDWLRRGTILIQAFLPARPSLRN